MLHIYAEKFDVTGNLESFLVFGKLRLCLVRKNFQDSPSHRIFDRMHGALNKDENKN